MPFISPDHPAPEKLKGKYTDTLNFNALIHITAHYRLTELTLYDPQAVYAARLEELMRRLKFMRVITERPEAYSEYNERCFETLGCCAAVTDIFNLPEGGVVFAVQPLPKHICKNGLLLLGAGGFTADISSLSVPTADLLCPIGVKKEELFTLLAEINGYAPLLHAVPRELKNGDNTISIEHLPIKQG